MSEPQKLFASLSGAFLAHVLLLVLAVAFPGTSSVGSSAKVLPEPKPKEITVTMGELVEHLEAAKLQAKPPEPAPTPAARPFAATDRNRPEEAAPERARFESDRNTTAASELLPDPALLGDRVPTLAGNNPLPHLTLQNREHVEGRIDQLPTAALPGRQTGSRSVAATPTPPRSAALGARDGVGSQAVAEAGSQASLLPPSAGSRDREKADAVGAGSAREGETRASRRRSYLDPSASQEAGDDSAEISEMDRHAADGGGEDGKAEPLESVAAESEPNDPSADPLASDDREGRVGSGEARRGPPEGMAASDLPEAAQAGGAESSLRPADDRLFSEGFSPEERENAINGSLAKKGANAVDAEETAMGRYKNEVRKAIAAKWHRYRRDNADFVTWGILKVEFSVDPVGRVKNLQITKNEANAMLAEFSLKAIRDAELPPMPPDVAKSVGAKGLVIQYDIIIY